MIVPIETKRSAIGDCPVARLSSGKHCITPVLGLLRRRRHSVARSAVLSERTRDTAIFLDGLFGHRLRAFAARASLGDLRVNDGVKGDLGHGDRRRAVLRYPLEHGVACLLGSQLRPVHISREIFQHCTHHCFGEAGNCVAFDGQCVFPREVEGEALETSIFNSCAGDRCRLFVGCVPALGALHDR